MIPPCFSTQLANGPGDQGSIPGRIVPKTKKMVLDATLLSTQHYKVWIKGKVEQSWEWSSALPTSRCSSYWKGSFRVTLRPPTLLTYIRYVLRVKWSNPGKGVAPYPTPRCSSDWKRSLLVTIDYSHQLYFYLFLLLVIWIHTAVFKLFLLGSNIW